MQLKHSLFCALVASTLTSYSVLADADAAEAPAMGDDAMPIDDGAVEPDAMPEDETEPMPMAEAPMAAGMWPECPQRLMEANLETHSLQDILNSTNLLSATNSGEDGPVFQQIIDKADAETQALVSDFDLMSEGYTMLVPKDTANLIDPATNSTMEQPLLEAFNVTIDTLTEAEATMIVLSHIVEGKITFASLTEATAGGETYNVTALSGYTWTFVKEGGEEDGFFAIEDPFGITPEGLFQVDADKVAVTDNTACPNIVMVVSNILATDEVTGDLPPPGPLPGAMAPAAAPVGAESPGGVPPTVPGTPTSPTRGVNTPMAPGADTMGAAHGLSALSAIAGALVCAAALL